MGFEEMPTHPTVPENIEEQKQKEKSQEWREKAKEATNFLIDEFGKIRQEMPEKQEEAIIEIAGRKYEVHLGGTGKSKEWYGQRREEITSVRLAGEEKEAYGEEKDGKIERIETAEDIMIGDQGDGTFGVYRFENKKIGEPLQQNSEKSGAVYEDSVHNPELAFDRLKAIREALEKKHYLFKHK